MGTSKNYFLVGCPKILAQIKVQKTQEYFVYFKFFELNSWIKRLGIPAKRSFLSCPNHFSTRDAMISLTRS